MRPRAPRSVPGETKLVKGFFSSCLPIINACNIPPFLASRTQVLFITVWDTPGTRIRKQLFYFISVITFQQISFTFQFGREDSRLFLHKFSINRFTAEGAIGPFPLAAINYPERRVLTGKAAGCKSPAFTRPRERRLHPQHQAFCAFRSSEPLCKTAPPRQAKSILGPRRLSQG